MVVGWGHAGLLGMFKDWVNMVVDGDGSPVASVERLPGGKTKEVKLYQLTTDTRRQVIHRADDVTATCDIGRGHRCPVAKKGNNTMEDWMHLLEWGVIAAFHGECHMLTHYDNGWMAMSCGFTLVRAPVAGDVLHPHAAEMLGKLRRALLYFMRPEGERVMDAADTLEAAQDALMDYCILASEYTSMRLCKYNMHSMLCRLAEQELCRGGASSCSELWIERKVQFGKSSVRYRATSFPETTLSKDLMLDMALATCRLSHPEAKTFDEHVPNYRTAEGLNVPKAGGNKVQDEVDEAGCLMLGYGSRVTATDPQHKQIVDAMQHLISDVGGLLAEEGWDIDDTDWMEETVFTKYKAADLASAEVVHGMEYKRARTRKSFFVLCHFIEGDDEQPVPYILRVRYFVVAQLHQEEHDLTLVSKFAVGDMWRCERVRHAIGSHWEVTDYEEDPPHPDWGVRLVDIQRKVIMVHPSKVVRVRGNKFKGERCKHRMFLEYSSRSRDQRNKDVDYASIARRTGTKGMQTQAAQEDAC
jgi:hypothetical protein